MKHWKCTAQPLNLDLLNILPDTQWGVSCIIIASRSSLHFFNECRHLSFLKFDDQPFSACETTFFLLIQGVPFEKSQKEMAVELKRCIFDRVLVKPKCV